MGFAVVFAAAAGLIGLLLAAAFVIPPPRSWAVVAAYVIYDTWLLWHHLAASLAALRSPPALPADGTMAEATVLMASHDEGPLLTASVAALGLGEGLRAIVIDDGSTDGSAEALAAAHGLAWEGDGDFRVATAPGSPLTVLRQPRAGKAAALNLGLARATGAVVVTVDADTVLEPGALAAIRRSFAADPGLAAACGVLMPTCAAPGPIAAAFAIFQAREYVRAFFWRLGWAAAGSLVLVSGAFAAYRRDLLVAAGGFDVGSLVEDYEVMYRLHRDHPGLRAAVLPGARARTDAPASVPRFLRQRARWFAGFIATLWRYRALVGDPRWGRLGTHHLRLKTLDTLLPLWGLAALAALAWTWWAHGRLDPLLLGIIAAKAALDAGLHAAAAAGYRRWLGLPGGTGRVLADLAASLVEQVCFQPLRQLGALLGWLTVGARMRPWRTVRSR